MIAYSAFVGLSLAWGFGLMFGPPYWRAALVGVVGGIGAYLVGGGW